MSTHKHIDIICSVVLVITLIISTVFMFSDKFGVEIKARTMGYENRLFDTSRVHSLDIVMNNWDSFIETCTNEEYSSCSVVIDGEAYKNVAIRAKGNTSLSTVKTMNSNRYSFKIEFDHYDGKNTYYGLDKLCLNNIIQDNTYMKDYLTYRMMNEFYVPAPLCSYVNITVNGEEWGLYLAVEAVEESFLMRNYGSNYGDLYKPDSMNMGGGKGNGKDFNMENFEDIFGGNNPQNPFGNGEMTFPEGFPNGRPDMGEGFQGGGMQRPDMGEGFPDNGMQRPDMGEGFQGGGMQGPNMGEGFPDNGMQRPDMGEGFQGGGMQRPDMGEGFQGGGMQGPNMGGKGSVDVSLIYTDDNYSSYPNIFIGAKTDVTDKDKDRLIASLKAMNEKTDIESCVYVEDVIRYFVVHNFVVNFDSYTGSMIHNYYLYEKNGQLSMIPWDYNLAFGTMMPSSDATALVNSPIDSPVLSGTMDSRPMIAWIFDSVEYTNLYHSLFSEWISDYFEKGKFEQEIDFVKEMISPYVQNDPSKFCTFEEFTKGIDTLKEFCFLRAESIRGQLEGTIGSTTETQQDKSNFVNAENVSTSHMGSMGMGGKMQGGQFPFENENKKKFDENVSYQNSVVEDDINNNQNQTPFNMNGGMQMPENVQGGNGNSAPIGSIGSINSSSGISHEFVLLVSSICVLLAGIVFAVLYKRRK